MLDIYKSTLDRELEKIDEFENGSWINLTNPTNEEIDLVVEKLGVEKDLIVDPLDLEESPRVEIEEEYMSVIIDIPILEEDLPDKDEYSHFLTIPIGIIILENHIITVCTEETNILKMFEENKVKSFFTFKKNRFLLLLLYKTSIKYLLYLKQIDRRSSAMQKVLTKSTRNEELFKFLELENSLIYFSTSLKANEMVLEKLLKVESLRKYEEDTDLLEDVIIENKQAIEMTNIYSNILVGTMDTFASIISNNQNTVMKLLAIATISLSIPNIITSFYGMNVALPFANNPHASLIILVGACVLSVVITFLFTKKTPF